MASKRDQLKKLKQSRASQPISDMPSPAEEKLNELETFENKEENLQKEHNNIEETLKSEETPKRKEEPKAEEYIKAENVSKPEEFPKAEVKAEVKPEIKVEQPVNTEIEEVKPQATAQEITETVKTEETISLKATVNQEPESQKTAAKGKEPTKRTSMALLVENNQFIRLRSMQLGMSIQNYINLLIDEEVEREKNAAASDIADITENLDMNYRRGQNSTIVALVLKESNAKFLKRGGAMHGMNSTAFLNHIISEEQKREKIEGPRKGEFDD